MRPISSKGMANRSCSTKARRSAGERTIEHDEESETDRVGEHGLLLGIGRGDVFRSRLGDFRVQGFFAARAARAKHVKADAGDDGGQPSAKIFDRVGIGAPEAQPGFLDGVVGLAERTQYAVRDRTQVPAILFEAFR
jgi:hypothetical protein